MLEPSLSVALVPTGLAVPLFGRLPTEIEPACTSAAPENVLVPLSASVPVPFLIRPDVALSEITPLTIASVAAVP